MRIESKFKTLRYVDFTGYYKYDGKEDTPEDYKIFKWLHENGKLEIYSYDIRYFDLWAYCYCELNGKYYVRQNNRYDAVSLDGFFYELDSKPIFNQCYMTVIEDGKKYTFCDNNPEPHEMC